MCMLIAAAVITGLMLAGGIPAGGLWLIADFALILGALVFSGATE